MAQAEYNLSGNEACNNENGHSVFLCVCVNISFRLLANAMEWNLRSSIRVGAAFIGLFLQNDVCFNILL